MFLLQLFWTLREKYNLYISDCLFFQDAYERSHTHKDVTITIV